MSDPKSKKGGNSPQSPSEFYKYSGMAIKMGLVILAGVFGGRKLDRVFALEKPILTLILSLLSVAVAIYIVISETKR